MEVFLGFLQEMQKAASMASVLVLFFPPAVLIFGLCTAVPTFGKLGLIILSVNQSATHDKECWVSNIKTSFMLYAAADSNCFIFATKLRRIPARQITMSTRTEPD